MSTPHRDVVKEDVAIWMAARTGDLPVQREPRTGVRATFDGQEGGADRQGLDAGRGLLVTGKLRCFRVRPKVGLKERGPLPRPVWRTVGLVVGAHPRSPSEPTFSPHSTPETVTVSWNRH